jgi:regulator of protease activity HflC (stomatin/prohibitin superfamily)
MDMSTFNKAIKQFVQKKRPAIILFLLLFGLFIAYLWNYIVIIIHSGEGGVMYRLFFGGTVVNRVYEEGIHIIFPWDRLYKYNTRVQEVSHNMNVLTKNGLKIELQVSIRYYPEYNLLGVLHKNVGPDYVHTVIIPEIESVLRIIIGKIDAEEVYTTKTSLIEEALNKAIEQVAQRFIHIDDVIIKKMLMPPDVEQSIQYKIEKKHLAAAHDYVILKEKKEAQRRQIEAESLAKYNQTLSASINKNIILWKGIDAAKELSQSENSKVIVVGGGSHGLPFYGSILLDSPDNASSKAIPDAQAMTKNNVLMIQSGKNN